ncbi:hypothetical protein HDF23_005882 [Mucilaginibacter lappiensis]|uniref:Uncharacterized protein n=1 Tax=Mucilaginibacter lappiensis TaxID=354630 RepID=A0ABR6PVE5_9SPHI|nr:hypothetical protein [Mucilaginibacter lappiensis]MBB6113099.1 hypothetical protein [Mucilaginibacter lappiensis]
MILNKNELIRAALYYSAYEWECLFDRFLNPFMEENKADLVTYYIFLSNYRGDHVRLIMKAVVGKEQLIIDKLTKGFENFVNVNPSGEPSLPFQPGKGLWMNFLNNSMAMNNFDAMTLLQVSLFDDLAELLSKIIQYYAARAVASDMESKIEFSISLLIHLFKPFSFDIAMEFLQSLMESGIQTSELSLLPDVVRDGMADAAVTAAENFDLLTELQTSEMTVTDQGDELCRLWLAACSSKLNSDSHYASVLAMVLNQYTQQFGFDELSKIYLWQLLKTFYSLTISNSIS